MCVVAASLKHWQRAAAAARCNGGCLTWCLLRERMVMVTVMVMVILEAALNRACRAEGGGEAPTALSSAAPAGCLWPEQPRPH